MVVDSGAGDSVIPSSIMPQVPVNTNTSQYGTVYKVANGSNIENEGEKKFVAYTDSGQQKVFNMQVAAVDKPLLSVSGVVKRGNRVVFDPQGSYIENLHTWEVTPVYEVNGMYPLPTWIPTQPF